MESVSALLKAPTEETSPQAASQTRLLPPPPSPPLQVVQQRTEAGFFINYPTQYKITQTA